MGVKMLTEKKIKQALKAGKDQMLFDAAPRGEGKLAFRIRGQKASWLFVYRIDGKRKIMPVGDAGADGLDLKAAQEAVKPFNAIFLSGVDPQVQKEQERRQEAAQEREQAALGTVEELAQAYVDDMRRRGKGSWKKVEENLLTGRYAVVDAIGAKMKAKDVTPAILKDVLHGVYKRGYSAASHMRGYLHSMFGFGIAAENDYTRLSQSVSFGLDSNPVSAIPVDKAARKVGTRALSLEEVGIVWKDIEKYGVTEYPAQAIRLILATGGQRVREVCEAPWSEFDMEGRLWILAPERTKNSREHRIPLTDRALEILTWLRENSVSEFLFPNGRDSSRFMPFGTLTRAAKTFTKQYNEEHPDGPEFESWSPRDLRRTVRTLLAEAGEPDHRLDYLLNHGRSVGVGQKHYDRSARLAEKTRTITKWDQLLDQALGETGQGKVISISKKEISPWN
jgi:integrase